jgi:hypothetical protein
MEVPKYFQEGRSPLMTDENVTSARSPMTGSHDSRRTLIERETISFAAVRASDGKIVRGNRHNDTIHALHAMDGYEGEEPHGENQGFVTSTGRFVNRRTAYRLHFPNRTEPDELRSDDLY